MEFRVTFGQQYHREPHPKVDYAHPDGWLAIEAPDMKSAREMAFEELGKFWAFIYDKAEFHTKYFPKGELHKITYDATRKKSKG